MKSNEIEEVRGSIRPDCNSRAGRRRAISRRNRSRRCCAQRSRDRIHSDWPAGHWPRKNQATGNWRAKSDPVARDRLNRHAESTALVASDALLESRRPRRARLVGESSPSMGRLINIGNALT